jgi:hypothetical protein
MKGGDKKPKRSPLGSRKDQKTRINEHEQSLADRLGGQRQPNSGATLRHKGDILLSKLLLDSKETQTNSLILTVAEIVKICREARELSREPGLVLSFTKAPVTMPAEWVAVPLEVFQQLLENQK